ncbi:type I-E CRISPR-associated protein Cas7/Cse4/CasC [Pseudonocardia adelaidensis]
MPRTIVDIHVLQTVPPSNLNRDDTGSPKTARYGGVVRARVSSQAWKRSTRTAFDALLDRTELGVRSKRLVELLGDEIVGQDSTLADRAPELAKAVLAAVGIKVAAPRGKKEVPEESGYLVFLSNSQIAALAALAVEHGRTGAAIDKKAAKKAADTEHSVDVALFGRMVAEDTDLNVDAAAQVAHALSVHAVETEYDYFTAVDDHKNADEEEDAGAGMIGTVEFNSSTLYRYATVDVDRLAENLSDAKATRRAVEAFVRGFVLSMPTGKQNTFANRTLPDAVYVVLRETQSINLVGAFEEAITTQPRIPAAITALATHATEVQDAYGEAPVAAWTFGPGERLAPLADIATRGDADSTVAAVGEAVAARLS